VGRASDARVTVTETNRPQCVLFGMQNRTFGPCLAMLRGIHIPEMASVQFGASVYVLPCKDSGFGQMGSKWRLDSVLMAHIAAMTRT
jgi:hypothetical protein